MSCKCKNIIENFQGGDIPLETTFLSIAIFEADAYFRGTIYSGSPSTDLMEIIRDAVGTHTPSFTGNTSGDCINELWVSTISGCSPVTIGSSLQSPTSSASGLYSSAYGSETTATGSFSHAEGRNTSAGGWSSHSEGASSISYGIGSHAQNLNTIAQGLGTHSGGRSSAIPLSYIIASGQTSFIHFEYDSAYPTTHTDYYGAYGDQSAILGGMQQMIQEGAHQSGIFGGSGHTIGTNVVKSIILGGDNISATTSNTVYVPNLNIEALVNLPNLVHCNDDTDAALSGLTVGDLYQTSGSGATPLDEIGIVMIKQ